MKAKFIGAILCVILLAACPFIAVASDGDTASENGTSSATVKVTDLTNSKMRDLFENDTETTKTTNVQSLIVRFICDPLCINQNIFNSYQKTTFDVDSFSYETGEMVVSETGNYRTSTFTKITISFTLTSTIQSSVSVIPLYPIGSTTYEGEGVSQMLSKFGNMTLYSGQTVEISGDLMVAYTNDYSYSNQFTNSGGTTFAKIKEQTGCAQQVHNLTMKIGSESEIKDKLDNSETVDRKWTYDIVNGSESSYTGGQREMVTYYEKNIVSCNGSKTFNTNSYPYQCTDESEEETIGPIMGSGPTETPTETSCYLYDLPLLTFYSNESDIQTKVAKYNGTATHDNSIYDSFYNEVESGIKQTVTIRFVINDFRYGYLTTDKITVNKGSSFTVDGDKLTIGSKTIIAHPSDAKDGYSYNLKTWGVTSGTVADGDMVILVEFEKKQQNSNDNTLMWVIIAILAILVVLLCAYIILKRSA